MLKIYNSLTSKIEEFKTIKPNYVSMYVCGPTVYDEIHIGNARPVIFFDVIKRYLTFRNYEVKYVSNVTDVDDRIVEKAIEQKQSEKRIAATYFNKFLEISNIIGSDRPDLMPKATDYIDSMIEYIDNLIKKGYAYQTDSGVYFRVHKIPEYGMLSKQNIDALNEGVRIELEQEKEDPRDFNLWKKTKIGVQYKSPWGDGRPGWHTECAVMNHDVFGEKIDIHGGGTDLKFPHHENEIAQSIAHDDHHLANYWLHVGRVDVDQVKMSKSLGNSLFVTDLVKTYDPMVFRLFIVSHHYRQPINYHSQLTEQFAKEYDKIKRAMIKASLVLKLSNLKPEEQDDEIINKMSTFMDDDFNTPNVMTLVYEIVKNMNKETDGQRLGILLKTVQTILDILGVKVDFDVSDESVEIYQGWQDARLNKDFEKADGLRQELIKRGLI